MKTNITLRRDRDHPAAPNQATMDYHFDRDSVAALREVAPGRYRTSTHRWLHLAVEVEPAGFAPLVEWRLDGKVQSSWRAATTPPSAAWMG